MKRGLSNGECVDGKRIIIHLKGKANREKKLFGGQSKNLRKSHLWNRRRVISAFQGIAYI